MASRTTRWASRLALSTGLAAASLSASLSSTPAAAQSDEERAGARAAATEGLQAFQQQRWADAVELFTKAESLVHAPPHLLYLGRAYEKLGKLVKAREAFQRLARERLADNAPAPFREAQASAAQELAAVEPRVPSLRIKVTGADKPQNLSVTIDGAPIAAALVGVSIPVDPGEHQLQASADGFTSDPVSVKLAEAEKSEATLTLRPGEAPPAAAAAAASAAAGAGEPAPATGDTGAQPAAEPDQGMRIASYAALGVGTVGLGVGTLFALQSSGSRKDADARLAECGEPCLKTDPRSQESQALYDDAGSQQTLAIVGFAVGGVGLAAGVTLFLLSAPKNESPATGGVEVTPWVGIGSVGATGRF